MCWNWALKRLFVNIISGEFVIVSKECGDAIVSQHLWFWFLSSYMYIQQYIHNYFFWFLTLGKSIKTGTEGNSVLSILVLTLDESKMHAGVSKYAQTNFYLEYYGEFFINHPRRWKYFTTNDFCMNFPLHQIIVLTLSVISIQSHDCFLFFSSVYAAVSSHAHDLPCRSSHWFSF